MNKIRGIIIKTSIILSSGLIGALICQIFIREPVDKYIHIRSFRYGKDPSVIRCNRGDRLHLTFSSDDTGHSFFLEEFDIDAKVSPASDDVMVYKTSDPSTKPVITRELVLTAKHPGILNYLISKSNYRCHVWCGPMHAFEQGKLIILPNTLLFFSLGSVIGIIVLWLSGIFRKTDSGKSDKDEKNQMRDILKQSGLLRRALVSRWPQIIITIIAMLMIYIVIMTSVFGTKVSGRNLGVMLMWIIWLFLIIVILTPIGGRLWCTICPLPFFGDWIQRRSFFSPLKGRTGEFNNRFFGLFLKWPEGLRNNWFRLIVFLILATFSTTMVAVPRISGIVIVILIIVPIVMSAIWELRAFCRYVCPVSVFVGPFSRMSILAIRNKSQNICDKCKTHFCQKGNANGWACPYGINVGELNENSDCGMCLECLRSCTYDNVSVHKRPFASELSARNLSEAWLTIAIFTVAIIYSVLYLGPWPVVRDYVNIIDKNNWGLFGIYSLILWSLSLLIVPGIIYLLSYLGKRLAEISISTWNLFLAYCGSLLPAGLLLWMAFVIPMLFVNITFIKQSVSDPFGWGWDFFGTANIPWHQFLSLYIPWFQALLVLAGLYFSLRNLKITLKDNLLKNRQIFLLSLPFIFFILSIAVFMLFFFTN
jgi:polyferredoxin